MRKFLLLVIDGLGVGEMADVQKERPQDNGAQTLKHIIQQNSKIHLANFQASSILAYFLHHRFVNKNYLGFNISLGKFNLAHFGADSYLGHQEIAGSRPGTPIRQFVREEKEKISRKLKLAGFRSRFIQKILLVEKYIAIADNIEADCGLNINVVGSLDYFPFKTIEKIGRLVREAVVVERVITMGGVNVSPEDFFRCFEEKTGDGCTSWGINIPRLKIYNNKYEVVHLGREICPARQAPGILTKQGINVILIGKAADVIGAEGAHHFSQVSTQKVLKLVLWCLEKLNSGLIFANIQETDLAGHEQNTRKYAFFLEMVDKAIPQILEKLSGDDIFLITGDHGNDPTIGHPNHTREKTPLILFSRKIKSQDYGERKTLADIGASITKFFHAPPPESGRSFI